MKDFEGEGMDTRDKTTIETAVGAGVGAGKLSGRSLDILAAITAEYIQTAEPVSSRVIAEQYSIGLKAASIRSVVAELEAGGYIRRPHHSAGSLPTEKSFRLYVDSLGKFTEPLESEKRELLSRLEGPLSADELTCEATRALSAITNRASLVLLPTPYRFRVKEIRLVPVDSARLMVVLVSIEGFVHSKVVGVEKGFKGNELERISNYLNSLGSGLSLRGLRDRVLNEMKREKTLYDSLLTEALRLGRAVLSDAELTRAEGASGAAHTEGLRVEGRTLLMDLPEFKTDLDLMKRLFSAFEEKGRLVGILNRCMDSGSTHIFLGTETGLSEFTGLSLVVTPYGHCGGDETYLGTLGVIGPVRMDYSRIIPLVDYTAKSLGKAL